jgi:TM2 domain-containing membrane protein YozV
MAPQAEPMPVPIKINMPPIMKTHSHGLAAVLSLILPGAGHAYCGHFCKALIVMGALVALGFLAMFCFATWYLKPLGLATVLLFALAMSCDAFYLEPKLPRTQLINPRRLKSAAEN